MNSKILFVAIAIVAAFSVAGAAGLATVTSVLAQDNMTMGGNMTGGNMTDANITQTGNISGCGNECF